MIARSSELSCLASTWGYVTFCSSPRFGRVLIGSGDTVTSSKPHMSSRTPSVGAEQEELGSRNENSVIESITEM